jgi:glycosyltransferase involved in cell wall biosynthesis
VNQPELPISVLMPVYNRREYVRLAVESILGQTFGHFEFVIIDDGSTDGATDILREYARRDRRVVLLEQENTGYTRALNRGLARARGEFIARMDSDDVSLPERLQVQVRFLRGRPRVVAVGGQGIEIDADGDWLRPLRKLLTHEEIEGRLLGHSPRNEGGLIHPAVLMRREAALRVGSYRPEYEPAEDRDLWLRLAEVGELANVPETVIQYRVHAGSVSVERAARQHDAARRAIEDAHRRRGLELPERIEMWSLEERQRDTGDIESGRALAAARHGYYRTARKYAARVLRRQPWQLRGWKALAVCALGSGTAARLGAWRRSAAARFSPTRGIGGATADSAMEAR